jgi:hypothetical protein
MDGVLLGVRNRKERCCDWLFLLQLATSEPEACWFSWGSTDTIITLSVPAIQHSIVSMCSAPTKYDLPLITSCCNLGILRGIPPLFRHIMDAGTDPHVPTCPSFQLIECMAFLTMHWSSSLLWSFRAIERCHPSTLKFEHRDHVYFCGSSTKRIRYQ